MRKLLCDLLLIPALAAGSESPLGHRYLLATTDLDNVNLMLAQIAQSEFGVASVIARVFDPARESLYRHLGILTVSPTELSAKAFLSAMNTHGQTE